MQHSSLLVATAVSPSRWWCWWWVRQGVNAGHLVCFLGVLARARSRNFRSTSDLHSCMSLDGRLRRLERYWNYIVLTVVVCDRLVLVIAASSSLSLGCAGVPFGRNMAHQLHLNYTSPISPCLKHFSAYYHLPFRIVFLHPKLGY
jgi:hypothetical protein